MEWIKALWRRIWASNKNKIAEAAQEAIENEIEERR